MAPHYLQVNFGSQRKVTSFLVRGRQGKNYFSRSYTIGYWNDAASGWKYIKDADTNENKVSVQSIINIMCYQNQESNLSIVNKLISIFNLYSL